MQLRYRKYDQSWWFKVVAEMEAYHSSTMLRTGMKLKILLVAEAVETVECLSKLVSKLLLYNALIFQSANIES